MAQFEPGKRPPRPPSDNPISDGIDRADQAARKLAGRRWLPRLPVPRRLREAYQRLPSEVRYRISVIWGFAQTALIVLFATLGVALVLKAVTNATVFEPSSARQVLAGTDNPEDVAYSVETIRIKTIDDSLLRLDSVRGIQVNPEKRKMMALISGVGVSSFRTAYDGKIWLLKYKDASTQRVNRTLSENDLRPVYASDLVPLADKIINNKASVDRQRGWMVSFKPNKAVLLRLLSAAMLSKLNLTNQDIASITKGNFKAEYGRATVLRGDRRLYQIDTTIRVNGARMRILATYRKQNDGRTKNLDLKPSRELEVN